jgi:hypothetical protein
MGLVYRARQSAPIKREVALKILKLGLDTQEVIARFEAEPCQGISSTPALARSIWARRVGEDKSIELLA